MVLLVNTDIWVVDLINQNLICGEKVFIYDYILCMKCRIKNPYKMVSAYIMHAHISVLTKLLFY